MENISYTARLKNDIQLLELKHAIKGAQLKEQAYLTLENLKPLNLLRSTLNDAASSPHLVDNVISTATGLATGYVSKIALVGGSGSLVRRLFGAVLQLGVTTIIAQHPYAVKYIGQFIFNKMRRKPKTEVRRLTSED